MENLEKHRYPDPRDYDYPDYHERTWRETKRIMRANKRKNVFMERVFILAVIIWLIVGLFAAIFLEWRKVDKIESMPLLPPAVETSEYKGYQPIVADETIYTDIINPPNLQAEEPKESKPKASKPKPKPKASKPKQKTEATKQSNKGSLTKKGGVNYHNGRKETWYSQRVLPGGGLDIPGRYVCEQGLVRDKDNYIVVASSDLKKGSVISTSLGQGKIYDTGCPSGVVDIYTDW